MARRPEQATDCDVLVIGGGPAGSTIAGLLARRGRHVVLLEKDRHPRFHIGESLLPMNMPIFEELGVLDQIGAIGMRKEGIDFYSDTESTSHSTVYFADAMDKRYPHAYQVRRSEFDEILLTHAAAQGVEVREGCRVTEIDRLDGNGCALSVRARDGAESVITARFLVDASGRDAFLSRRLGLLERNPDHNAAAIFGHFRNVPRGTGRDEGNIGLHWFDQGWFWVIPLKDGITSVGAVCWPEYLKSRGDAPLDDFLWRTVERAPTVQRLLENAELVAPAQGTGNYSYSSSRLYGDGYLLIGDAFAFVDPVFSSGVFLAMKAAQSGAGAVDAVLAGDANASAILRRHERRLRRGIRILSWFIYRFNSPAIRWLFLNPGGPPQIKAAVLSVLAGDTFGRTPIGLPIFQFKLLYLALSLSRWRDALSFLKLRRRSNRQPSPS